MSQEVGDDVRVVVHGWVQGVGFRWSTQRELARLGLDGTAENLPDGTVLVVARGPSDALAGLVAWLRGPGTPGRVDRVDVEADPARSDGIGPTP